MQAIHVTGSDSFLCQGDFLNGTSPSGELMLLKACFTIKTTQLFGAYYYFLSLVFQPPGARAEMRSGPGLLPCMVHTVQYALP